MNLGRVVTEDPIDDPRREFLVRALALGAFVVGDVTNGVAQAGIFGDVPKPLTGGRSIYKLRGSVTVNGKPATPTTVIRPNDLIETGPASRIVFVVGKDAYLLRSNSHLQLKSEGSVLVNSLRLVSGKLLSVFGKRRQRIETAVATIGIRGTGVYVESDPEQSYVCTCYGTTELSAADDPNITETIVSDHHDAPRYILASDSGQGRIRSAPFINHTDEELQIIEALVGRTPPFSFSGGGYSAPRRRNY